MSSTQQLTQRRQIDAHVEYCREVTNDTSGSALQLKLDLVKRLYEEFKENQKLMEENCKGDKELLQAQHTLRGNFEDCYFFCHVKLQDTITKKLELNDLIRNKDRVENNGVPRQQEVKLPRIELIPFSANMTIGLHFTIFSQVLFTTTKV